MTTSPLPATVPAYDLAPLLPVLAIGGALTLLAVAWQWRRHRHAGAGAWIRALTVLALVLTFDLILFGAFTRLSDSGLGCPDWPGCYGTASPVGATAHIDAAQTAQPTGPVSHGKAWIEMIHRYLATAVGGLILLLTGVSWWRAWRDRARAWRDRARARPDRARPSATRARDTVLPKAGPSPPSPWWSTATLAWVCLQGAFGAWTVTLKLYPAIVTAHLLGGFGLLVLLALQHDRHRHHGRHRPLPTTMSRGLFLATVAVTGLAVLQASLGGWVSTNYAVLACRDFPTCQGSWWPAMDFAGGFVLRRGLGLAADGGYLPYAALTAIHMAHRMAAGVLLSALVLLAWRLRATGDPSLRRWSLALASVAGWQLLTGLGNVVLGWPVIAALAHTGGAAVLLTLLAVLISRAEVRSRLPDRSPVAEAMALGTARPPAGRLPLAP